MHQGTFSPSAVFFFFFPFSFFFFLSHRTSTAHVSALTRFSLSTSVALGPMTPVTCNVPGLPPSPPPPSSPWSLTAGAESLASAQHFLRGVLPPASCLSLTRIVTEIVSVELYLSGHRCLPPWHCFISLLGLTFHKPHLPPPQPLLPFCRRLAKT